jgi:hypothetical protein
LRHSSSHAIAAARGDEALIGAVSMPNPGRACRASIRFPINTAASGGPIYQRTLGFHVSVLDVARRRGHAETPLKRRRPAHGLLDAL